MELTTIVWVNEQLTELFMITKIQKLNGTHNNSLQQRVFDGLFMITKIQKLNGTHNYSFELHFSTELFMITKIQKLNGTHNINSTSAR